MTTPQPPKDVKADKTCSYPKVAHGEEKSASFKPSHDDTIKLIKAELNEETNFPMNYVDVDVDIIVSTSASYEKPAAGDGNSTEYSSSFDGSDSDTEIFSGFNEPEVESTFYDHSTMANRFDAFGSGFPLRKKKLTDQWRNFVHPLTWRCKWAELKVRQMESQSSKYSQELAAYDQAELPELDQHGLDDFCLTSQPYAKKFYEKAMKRRNRKRTEDVTDASSYICSHNLFSYFETKRSGPDGPSMADEFNNSVITYQENDSDEYSISNDRLFLEVRGGDNLLEPVLLKIERVQSQVQKLKSQLDVLILNNAVKFGSSENLSLLEQTSSLISPICAPNHCISDYNYGDLVLPESDVLSFVEANPVPDIVESTVGMLSATEVTAHQPHIADSHEIIVDNVLLHKEVTERERRTRRTTKAENQVTMKIEQGESTGLRTIPASGLEGAAKSIKSAELSTTKPCLGSDFHFQNKRKRGERKACSGNWTKQESCEPDSQ